MCMTLLRQLAAQPLPCTENDPAMIDRLRVLQAVGHIEVRIPPAHGQGDHGMRQAPATVLQVTRQGHRALHAQVLEEDEAPWPAAWFSGTRRRSGG